MGSFVCCPKDLGTQGRTALEEALSGWSPEGMALEEALAGFVVQNTKARDGSWKIFGKRKHTACVNSSLIGGSAGFRWEAVVTLGTPQPALVPDVLFQCHCYEKQGWWWPEMLAHLPCQIKQFHLQLKRIRPIC